MLYGYGGLLCFVMLKNIGWVLLFGGQTVFEKFDRDRSRTIEQDELRNALFSLGFAVPPQVLQMLVSKYDSTGQSTSIGYDNFIQYVLWTAFYSLTFCIVHRCMSLRVQGAGGEQTLDSCLSSLDEPALLCSLLTWDCCRVGGYCGANLSGAVWLSRYASS